MRINLGSSQVLKVWQLHGVVSTLKAGPCQGLTRDCRVHKGSVGGGGSCPQCAEAPRGWGAARERVCCVQPTLCLTPLGPPPPAQGAAPRATSAKLSGSVKLTTADLDGGDGLPACVPA